MLPDGSGATVLEYIRTRQLPIRVAVTTGASNWQAMLAQLQPDALFTKPLDFNQVVNWLSEPQ
jgi:DNA-binding NtrC family response regulator